MINKKLLTKNDMKEIVYSTNKTENPVTEQSFVTRFLQSVTKCMAKKILMLLETIRARLQYLY